PEDALARADRRLRRLPDQPQRLRVERLRLQPHQLVRLERLRQLDRPAQLEPERHVQCDPHVRPQAAPERPHDVLGAHPLRPPPPPLHRTPPPPRSLSPYPIMFSSSAVNPPPTPPPASSSMPAVVRTVLQPSRSARFARTEPQWLQYSRSSSRIFPPNSCQTGAFN